MPPSPVGKLLLAGKLRSGTPWYKIDAQLGIVSSRREFWLSGRVLRLPLLPIVQLAIALKIDPREFFSVIETGNLPPWASHELAEYFDDD